MPTLHLVLMIVAIVCFLLDAFRVQLQRVSLTPLGLFCWAVAAVVIGRW
jgi:hypothetical protein